MRGMLRVTPTRFAVKNFKCLRDLSLEALGCF